MLKIPYWVKKQTLECKIIENSMYSHGMACELVPAKDSFVKEGRKTEYLLSLKADIKKSGEIWFERWILLSKNAVSFLLEKEEESSVQNREKKILPA